MGGGRRKLFYSMVAKTTDDENGGVVCVSLQDVNRYKGKNYPIMNLQERVLSVLACRVGEREREKQCSLQLLPSSLTKLGRSRSKAPNIV